MRRKRKHAGGELTLKHCNRLRCELEHFRDYCAGLGLLAPAAIESEHVLAYKNSVMKAAGEKGRETARKRMRRLTGFFSFCMNDMPWITRNPAKGKLISIKSKKTHEPKALTDAQFEQALAVVPKLNGRTTAEIRAKLRSLFLLMKWTGLAIRDALTTVERSDFQRVNESFYTLHIKRAKTDNAVFCTLEAPLVDEIFAGANPAGRYLFVSSVPTTEGGMNNLVHQWGTLFSEVSDLAGLVDHNGEPYPFTSHSMRHTFVFWCLNQDIPTEDIAMLIGDSVVVVAKYYSVWIHGRQERLTQRMVEALKNKPSKA
jgi:integrase/recombinase XerD